MKNKLTLSALTLFGVGTAIWLASFFPPQVQAGGAWEIDKKSYVLSCSSVMVKGTTNAPFEGVKVWGSSGTSNLLVNSFSATAGDTSNAQTADYKVSVRFAPQQNGTPIHVQVYGSLKGTAPGEPVMATPVNIVANCVDPNATPIPSPTASITASLSPEISSLPAATPATQASPQSNRSLPWWEKIWQHLMGLLGKR